MPQSKNKVRLILMMHVCLKKLIGRILFVLTTSFLLLSACTAPIKQEISTELQVTEVQVGPKAEEYSNEPPILDGTWKSPVPERAGNGRYSIRELKFNGTDWELKYTLADDKKMSKVLFIHKAKGIYFLQNASKRIPGTYLIGYRPKSKSLMIHIKDKKILKEFGFDECQMIGNSEFDISTNGCGLFAKIADCQTDFDLIRQHKNTIEIGDRYAEFNSCTEDKRPVALGFTLEKQK